MDALGMILFEALNMLASWVLSYSSVSIYYFFIDIILYILLFGGGSMI
jgi:hypothetical protein